MEPPTNQDFFFDLMRESQRARAPQLAERDRWIRTLELSGREEVLFELEMLLRGLDRFFALRNLFGETPPAADRDFRDELRAARDAIHRSIHLARRLTLQKHEQQLLFRRFVEGALADDRERAQLGAALREQRTPEESLFLLRAGLVAHEGILDQLLRAEGQVQLPASLFLHVGRALTHELFVSRYFAPPAAFEFRAEYDRVGSVRLLESLRKVPDDRARRAFSLALLAAFRSLRSLRFVPAAPTVHTRRVLVTLSLVRAEIHALIGYLDTELPRQLATPAGVPREGQVGHAAAALLREALQAVPPVLAAPLTERRQLDEMRDRLAFALKGAVGVLGEALDPALGRRALFEDAQVRIELSERLRRDLWIFRELSRAAAEALDSPESGFAATGPLRRFATEFRDVGYQLLRHADRELFDRFLELLRSSSRDPSDARVHRLRDDCLRFAEILDRAAEVVGRRAELVGHPADVEQYRRALALQWGEG